MYNETTLLKNKKSYINNFTTLFVVKLLIYDFYSIFTDFSLSFSSSTISIK